MKTTVDPDKFKALSVARPATQVRSKTLVYLAGLKCLILSKLRISK